MGEHSSQSPPSQRPLHLQKKFLKETPALDLSWVGPGACRDAVLRNTGASPRWPTAPPAARAALTQRRGSDAGQLRGRG